MKTMCRAKYGVSALAFGLTTNAIASLALAQAPWAEGLALQIKALHDCDVALLTQVLEREGNDRIFVMAKVHCEDGRTFDAFKPSGAQLFKFTECERPEERDC